MSEPRRYLEEGGDLASLLQAGVDEAPSPELRRRADVALGLVAATAVTTATASSVAASHGLGAAVGVTKAAPAVTALVLAKWVGVTVLVCATAAGTTALLGPRKSSGEGKDVAAQSPLAAATSPRPSRAPAQGGPSTVSTAGQTVSVAATPLAAAAASTPLAAETAPAPVAVGAPHAAATSPVTPGLVTSGLVTSGLVTSGLVTSGLVTSGLVNQGTPSAKGTAADPARALVDAPAPDAVRKDAPREPTVTEETAMIDAAKAALRDGDGARAIQLVDKHDLACERPKFAPEALVVRIEAYAARHDRAETVELCNRFLRLYPELPQAQHVRSILSASNP